MGQSDIKIPNGIVYIKSSTDTNQYVLNILKKEINNPEYKLFDNHLYCGPNLWSTYKTLNQFSRIKGGDLYFQIPQNDGTTKNSKGKIIQNNDDFKLFWNQIISDLKEENWIVRPLLENEMLYYWSIISFNISEPIFIIESKESKFIVDLSKNGHLLFIETTPKNTE
jgi:hypothetical protein